MDKIKAAQTRIIMYEAAKQIAPKFGYNASEIANYCTAIAFVESTFNPMAKTKPPHTAKGLMQINNITKKDAETQLGLPSASDERMFDANYNAYLGTHIFCTRLARCGGDVKKAVAAYNQGNCGTKAVAAATVYVARWQAALNTMGFTNIARTNEGSTNDGFETRRNWY